MSHMNLFRAAVDALRGPPQHVTNDARLAEQMLLLLEAQLDNPMMRGGSETDVVSIHFTKAQIAMLAVLVKKELRGL